MRALSQHRQPTSGLVINQRVKHEGFGEGEVFLSLCVIPQLFSELLKCSGDSKRTHRDLERLCPPNPWTFLGQGTREKVWNGNYLETGWEQGVLGANFLYKPCREGARCAQEGSMCLEIQHGLTSGQAAPGKTWQRRKHSQCGAAL